MLALKMEKRNEEPRKPGMGEGEGAARSWKNSRKQIIPCRLRKEHSLANTLILLQ